MIGRARRARVALRRDLKRLRWQSRVRVRAALGLPPPERVARVMHEVARARPGAFVVQVGSHDSSQLDPLRRYILTRGWRGILVEPIPTVFARLKENYANVEGLVFENVAIAPRDGTMDIFFIPQTEDLSLPPWYDALASFRKDVLLAHEGFIPEIETRIRSMEVPCMTFQSMCDKHNVERIDVVQIDTEGYDLAVLKLIDLGRFRPLVVQFEELHLSDAETAEACDLLAKHGYETFGNGMDRIALAMSQLGSSERRLANVWDALAWERT